MKTTKDNRLIQHLLDGELNAEEESQLKKRIETSADLRTELEQSLRLRKLLANHAGEYDPFFSTRVMAGLHSDAQTDEWSVGLFRIFRRVVAVAFVLALFMTAHNVITQWDQRSSKSAVELTLGIPSATISSSLDYLDCWL